MDKKDLDKTEKETETEKFSHNNYLKDVEEAWKIKRERNKATKITMNKRDKKKIKQTIKFNIKTIKQIVCDEPAINDAVANAMAIDNALPSVFSGERSDNERLFGHLKDALERTQKSIQNLKLLKADFKTLLKSINRHKLTLNIENINNFFELLELTTRGVKIFNENHRSMVENRNMIKYNGLETPESIKKLLKKLKY